MAVKILVATPILSFGELIKTTLTSHGDFLVRLCETGDQALEALAGDIFDVLIMDAAITDQPFAPLVQKIVASLPDQKIAVIPPDNKPDHHLLENVPAHGFLFRPFLDPDLINLVQRLAAAAEEDRHQHDNGKRIRSSSRKEEISWTEDPAQASIELARLLLGSSALAGLVIHNGELWVHSGRISAEASQEINQMLSQVKAEKEKDLVRFTFLVADDCEALVYAVQLIAGWTLALVYDVSMPLTRVRSQATTVAAHLRSLMRLESLVDKIAEEGFQSNEEAPAVSEGAEMIMEPGTQPEGAETEPESGSIEEEISEDAEGESNEEALDALSLDEDLIALINEVNQATSNLGETDSSETVDAQTRIDRLYTETVRSPGGLTPEKVEHEPQASVDQNLDESGIEESVQISADQDAVEIEGNEPVQTAADQNVDDDEVEEPAQPSTEESEEPAEGALPQAETMDVPVEMPEAVSADQPADQIEAPMAQELERQDEILSAAEVSVRAALGEAAPVTETDLEDGVLHPEELQDEPIEAQTIPPFVEDNERVSPLSEGAGNNVGEAASASGRHEMLPPLFQRMGAQKAGCQFFTLVFTPAGREQFLTGELASYLGELLKTAPRPYPWKLTGVSIRPEYLRLSIEISEFLEPSDIIHFIKEYTSTSIREKFQRPDEAGGGNAFWAEENLVLLEHSVPDGTQLREFVQSVKSKAVNPV